MQPIGAARPPHSQIAVAIHVVTEMPWDPSDLAADYVPGRPPANLLTRCDAPPHDLFHSVAGHLATPQEQRAGTFIGDLPVHIHSMGGFDVTVEVPSLGEVYVFDATDGSFHVAASSWDALINVPPRDGSAWTPEVRARAEANEQLRGTSAVPVQANIAQIAALLDVPEDLRPAISINTSLGVQYEAHVRDFRGTHVLVEVAGRVNHEGESRKRATVSESTPLQAHIQGLHVFDLARGELDFQVNAADPAAHTRYVHAARDAGKPFPLPDKA